MATTNDAAVGERQFLVRDGEEVRQFPEDAAAQIAEAFEVGLADFAEQEAFEAGVTLAIVTAHLGDEPMTFAAATRAAIAEHGRTFLVIALARDGAGEELAFLKDDSDAGEVEHLIVGTAGATAESDVVFEFGGTSVPANGRRVAPPSERGGRRDFTVGLRVIPSGESMSFSFHWWVRGRWVEGDGPF